MSKKSFILILLFSSWFLSNVHRAWNNLPVKKIHPALCIFEPDYEVTIHWYAHFILKDISYILIFYSIWIYINSALRKDADVLLCFGAIFLVQCMELPHYLLAARHSEWVLLFQCLLIITVAVLIRTKKSSKVIEWIRY
jgi:hypothetical protein